MLILDEATSAIGMHCLSVSMHIFSDGCTCTDYNTDKIIQQSLRKELGKDVTLITIAHRLQTIVDMDRIVRLFILYLSC